MSHQRCSLFILFMTFIFLLFVAREFKLKYIGFISSLTLAALWALRPVANGRPATKDSRNEPPPSQASLKCCWEILGQVVNSTTIQKLLMMLTESRPCQTTTARVPWFHRRPTIATGPVRFARPYTEEEKTAEKKIPGCKLCWLNPSAQAENKSSPSDGIQLPPFKPELMVKDSRPLVTPTGYHQSLTNPLLHKLSRVLYGTMCCNLVADSPLTAINASILELAQATLLYIEPLSIFDAVDISQTASCI